MKRNLPAFLHILSASLLFSLSISAQPLEPFDSCPGVSVAITRPGFNANLVPHQIYLVTDSTGEVQPVGHPIELQINGFGLNNLDGFLYGMHETFNVANPFLTRVDKNGNYRNVGTILAPSVGRFKVGLVNTAAGTMDDEDNYYFTAVVLNLQNIMLPPELFLGKIEKVSGLQEGDRPLNVKYKKINPGTCSDELLRLLANPLSGALQDIAFNPGDGNIYTYLPGDSSTGAKIAWLDPDGDPMINCIDPPTPNMTTADLSGLFFSKDTTLYILTTDGNYYAGNIDSGTIKHVALTTLPLQNGNLRGDMASCVGKKRLAPFDGCPGLALAITRPGINNTGGPHQVYSINPLNGATRAIGHPINLQINAFGLNSKDGFLYGMHEVSEIFGPKLARVDSNGNHIDIGTLHPPASDGNRVGIINTAAATMDGDDNYYFTAVVADTQNILNLPRLYLGVIKKVSKLEEGDSIEIRYQRVLLGTCADEIIQSLLTPGNGLLQDIAFDPQDERIYTYIQSGPSPARGKLAYIRRTRGFLMLNCINPRHENPLTQDLSGMHADKNGKLFILTIDGKYYKGNPSNGVIELVNQTSLPTLGGNLRGDMASCVKKKNKHHGDGHGDEDDDEDEDEQGGRSYTNDGGNEPRVAPNPINGNEVVLYVDADKATAVDLRIVDQNGYSKQSSKQTLQTGSNQVRLRMTDNERGVFALVLTYPDGHTSVVKFLRL